MVKRRPKRRDFKNMCAFACACACMYVYISIHMCMCVSLCFLCVHVNVCVCFLFSVCDMRMGVFTSIICMQVPEEVRRR